MGVVHQIKDLDNSSKPLPYITLLLQLIALDLAADRLGQAVLEDDDTRIFIRSGMGLDVVLDLLLELVGTLGSLDEHDGRLEERDPGLCQEAYRAV